MDVMRRIAMQLESGAFDGVAARLASRAWGRMCNVVRDVQWADPTRVLAIGGATLGGSGKTPLALACAGHLAEAGCRVAIVGHAYRARPGRARIVEPSDPVSLVGDEALMCAREIAARGQRRVVVVVAPDRQSAVDLAADAADVLILDGVAQTSPRRASLALLSVDAGAPWGSAALPPAGDLRAPVHALRAACDAIVSVGAGTPIAGALGASVVARGAYLEGRHLSWADLGRLRIGLYTALARPARVRALLAHNGVTPACVIEGADHSPVSRRARSLALRASGQLDLWLCSPKCACHLEHRELGDVPVAQIDYSLAPSSELREALDPLLLPTRRAQRPRPPP